MPQRSSGSPGKHQVRGLGRAICRIGGARTYLANTSLQNDIPAFHEAKALLSRKAESLHIGGGVVTKEIQGIWKRLAELANEVNESFPL